MSRAMTLPLASRIALVTGASRGIGYATALALAKAGAHIVAVARTQGGLEELDDAIRAEGGSATLVPLNITDLDGLSRLGAALHERHGKLDILVGNAGVAGPSSPLGHIELKAWNDTMATNLTANFQLIRCMEPLLQQSDAGPRGVPHIRHRQQGLCLSRPLCRLQGCAGNAGARLGQRDRHDEYPRQPVQSRPVRTHMRAIVMPGEDPETLDTPAQVAETIVPLCLPSWTETGKFVTTRPAR
jgi:hypothetical protein